MAGPTTADDMVTAQNIRTELRYVDIGVNLGDPVFKGEYNGKQKHQNDLDDVVQRAVNFGCRKMMVTGSDLKESTVAVRLAEQYPGLCYATVGVHPCAATQFDQYNGGSEAMMLALRRLIEMSKATGHTVAFGEIGLDYDRLHLTPKDQQLKYFEAQLKLAVDVQLPLFLHSRAAGDDFERLISAFLPMLPKKGLVHSFTGTTEEMWKLVDLGLDIGINGCSMKSQENVEVVRQVPLQHLQIETDAPWCEMRPSHASMAYMENAPSLPKAVKKEKWTSGLMVKGRNEPVNIALVAHAIARIKNVQTQEVCLAAWQNSVEMFGLGELLNEAIFT